MWVALLYKNVATRGHRWDGESGRMELNEGWERVVQDVAIVVKPTPRFLDEDNVYCLVCEVEEGLHDICRLCCIVLDKAYGLAGAV